MLFMYRWAQRERRSQSVSCFDDLMKWRWKGGTHDDSQQHGVQADNHQGSKLEVLWLVTMCGRTQKQKTAPQKEVTCLCSPNVITRTISFDEQNESKTQGRSPKELKGQMMKGRKMKCNSKKKKKAKKERPQQKRAHRESSQASHSISSHRSWIVHLILICYIIHLMLYHRRLDDFQMISIHNFLPNQIIRQTGSVWGRHLSVFRYGWMKWPIQKKGAKGLYHQQKHIEGKNFTMLFHFHERYTQRTTVFFFLFSLDGWLIIY